jgi:flagellar biosynthesis anti-sigma factor FlgM
MNIDYTELNPAGHSRSNSARSVENDQDLKQGAVEKKQVAEQDQAEVSELARIMARIHPVLEDNPEIRTDLVERLRTEIQNGSYQVQVDEIVDRLISGNK